MKFNLTRQIISDVLNKILDREIKRQGLKIPILTKELLKALSQVKRSIEKWTLPRYLIKKKLEKRLGYGIFLHPDTRPLIKGEILAFYAGRASIVPQNAYYDGSYTFEPMNDMHLTKEEQIALEKKQRFHPRRLYTLRIDAIKEGNFTRFINHSDKPNVQAQLVRVKKSAYGFPISMIEVLYVVKKTIYPGEQLLISYEEGEKGCYWRAAKIKPFPMTPKTFTLSPSLKLLFAS